MGCVIPNCGFSNPSDRSLCDTHLLNTSFRHIGVDLYRAVQYPEFLFSWSEKEGYKFVTPPDTIEED